MRRRAATRWIVVAALLIVTSLLAPPARAAITTFQEGVSSYNSTKDTNLDEEFGRELQAVATKGSHVRVRGTVLNLNAARPALTPETIEAVRE